MGQMMVGTLAVNTVGLGLEGWYTNSYTLEIPNKSVLVMAAIANHYLPNMTRVAVAIRRYTYMDSSGINQTVELQDTVSNGAIICPNCIRIDNATSVTFEVGMNGGGFAQAVYWAEFW